MSILRIADYIKTETNKERIIINLTSYLNKNFSLDNRLEIITFFRDLKNCLKSYSDKLLLVEKIEQMSLHK